MGARLVKVLWFTVLAAARVTTSAPTSGPASLPAAGPATPESQAPGTTPPTSPVPSFVLVPSGAFGHSGGWALGVDTGLKGDGVEAGLHVLAPFNEHWAAHARVYLLLEGITQRPAGEAMIEGILRSQVVHGILRFYGTLGMDFPFLANKLTGTTFVRPSLANLFFIGGNTGFEFFQDGSTVYFIEIGWWGGYQATRFTLVTTNPAVPLHPWVGSGPLINAGVRWYFR